MKIKVITIILISLAIGAGSTAGYYQDKLNDQQQQASAKFNQLKDVDDKIFDNTKGAIDDYLGCADPTSGALSGVCLDRLNEKLDVRKVEADKLKEQRSELTK